MNEKVIGPQVPDNEHNAPRYLRPQAYKINSNSNQSRSEQQINRKKETNRLWRIASRATKKHEKE
jgi:hypothetical protein